MVPSAGPSGPIQLQDLVSRVITISVGLAFIIIFIVLILAGFRYLTSGGDPKNIQAAGQTITWALVGGLLLALAWIIVKLIENFTGVQVSLFCIGFPGVPTYCP